ncbi:MAG: DUF3105 domain-containing protein [bacterium]|nr:DUF3105 domain-containing protein [bacterium]
MDELTQNPEVGTGSGVEPTKKEKKEQKRAEKLESRAADTRARKTKKLIIQIGIFLGIIGLGLLLWYSIPEPRDLGDDFATFSPSEGRNHLDEGTDVDYGTNPPTSGNHWATPVLDGVYDRPQPDEGLVHSLEHGRVWISYKSTIPADIIEKLEKIGRSYPRMIVTVRDENPTDITIAAWTRFDAFNVDEFSEARILDFQARYDETGPEKGIPAHSGKVYP